MKQLILVIYYQKVPLASGSFNLAKLIGILNGKSKLVRDSWVVRAGMPHDMSVTDSYNKLDKPRKATTPQTTFSSKCQSNAGPWWAAHPALPPG